MPTNSGAQGVCRPMLWACCEGNTTRALTNAALHKQAEGLECIGNLRQRKQTGARLVDDLGALHHAGERVGEPVLELGMGGEDLGHEEVHERPQLHQVVLQRRACAGLTTGFDAVGQELRCIWGSGDHLCLGIYALNTLVMSIYLSKQPCAYSKETAGGVLLVPLLLGCIRFFKSNSCACPQWRQGRMPNAGMASVRQRQDIQKGCLTNGKDQNGTL